MTLKQLEQLIEKTDWFLNIGQDLPVCLSEAVQLRDLRPWADNSVIDEVANRMDWLPSSNYQDDPIHNGELKKRAEAEGRSDEIKELNLSIYRKAAASLKKFTGHPLLHAGPHNFTAAARGAALFASRQASFEILVGKTGFWCFAMDVYKAGRWPCGILPDKTLVVL